MSFFMSYDLVTMTVMCDIILTLSFQFQNKIKENEK